MTRETIGGGIRVPGTDVTFEVSRGVEARDDAAEITIKLGGNGPEVVIVQTTDFIRGPHFQLYEAGYLSPYDLGWYLAGANLSDIAAMGAQPVSLTIVIRYKKGFTGHDFEEIMSGARDCCREYGKDGRIVGGDTGGYVEHVLSASATGITSPDRILRQDAAKPGDTIWVTGPTGLAGAARLAHDHELIAPGLLGDRGEHGPLSRGNELAELLTPWRKVHPRVKEGLVVAALVGCGCGTDTSDGLYVAVNNIAKKSGVISCVDTDRVPIHSAVEQVARCVGRQAIDVTMGNSVDFQLLFTTPEDMDPERVITAFREDGLPKPYAIGRIKEAEPGNSPVIDQHGNSLSAEIERHIA